jgi:hypothetical protein
MLLPATSPSGTTSVAADTADDPEAAGRTAVAWYSLNMSPRHERVEAVLECLLEVRVQDDLAAVLKAAVPR